MSKTAFEFPILALFGFGFAISVTALPQQAAEDLIQQPVADRIVYQPDAIERITTVCARHPFLIQLLCARVFDQAAIDEVRRVSKRQVDVAIDDLVSDMEHFRTLWGYAGSEHARTILWICHHLYDGPDPVTFDLLENMLEARQVHLTADDLRGDLEHLRELELMSLVEDGAYHVYQLAIPLMGLWIQRNVDSKELMKLAVQEGRSES